MSVENIINSDQVKKFGQYLPTPYIDRISVLSDTIKIESSCYFSKPQDVNNDTFEQYIEEVLSSVRLVSLLMPEGRYTYTSPTDAVDSISVKYLDNILDNSRQFHFDTVIKNDPSKIFDLLRFCYHAKETFNVSSNAYNVNGLGIDPTFQEPFSFASYGTLQELAPTDILNTFDIHHDNNGNEVRRYRLEQIVTLASTALGGASEEYKNLTNLFGKSNFKFSIASFTTTLPISESDDFRIVQSDSNYGLKNVYLKQISDITYEQVANNRRVKSPTRQVFISVGSGQPYTSGDVIQSFDSLYYGDDGITRQQIKDTFTGLISNFKTSLRKIPQSSVGPSSFSQNIVGAYRIDGIAIDEELLEAFDNINYILNVHGNNTDLVPKLRQYEKVFPSTSTTTPLGEFHEKFQIALFNVNNAVKRGTQLVKTINVNPIVKDLRSRPVFTIPERFQDFSDRTLDTGQGHYLNLPTHRYCCYTDPNSFKFKNQNTLSESEQLTKLFGNFVDTSAFTSVVIDSPETVTNIQYAFKSMGEQFFNYTQLREVSSGTPTGRTRPGLPEDVFAAFANKIFAKAKNAVNLVDLERRAIAIKELVTSFSSITDRADPSDMALERFTGTLFHSVLESGDFNEYASGYLFKFIGNQNAGAGSLGDLNFLFSDGRLGEQYSDFYSEFYNSIRLKILNSIQTVTEDIDAATTSTDESLGSIENTGQLVLAIDGAITEIASFLQGTSATNVNRTRAQEILASIIAMFTSYAIYKKYEANAQLQIDSLNSYLFGYWWFDYEKALIELSTLSFVYDVKKIEKLYGKQITNDKFMLRETRVDRHYYAEAAKEDKALGDKMGTLVVPDTSFTEGVGLQKIGRITTVYDDTNIPVSCRIRKNYSLSVNARSSHPDYDINAFTPLPMISQVSQNQVSNFQVGDPIGTIGFDAVQNSDIENTYCVLRNTHWPGYLTEVMNGSPFNMYEYRLMVFEHQEVQGPLTCETAKTTSDFPFSGLAYEVTIEDQTSSIVYNLVQSFVSYFQNTFSEYFESAAEQCNFNSYDEKYSDLFIETMSLLYDDNPNESPWYVMPAMYHLHLDLLFNAYQGDSEQILQAAIDESEKLTPTMGSFSELSAFQQKVKSLIDDFYKPGGTSNIFDRVNNAMATIGTETTNVSDLYSLSLVKPTLSFNNNNDIFCGIPKPINLINTLKANRLARGGGTGVVTGYDDPLQVELRAATVTNEVSFKSGISIFANRGADVDNRPLGESLDGLKYSNAYKLDDLRNTSYLGPEPDHPQNRGEHTREYQQEIIIALGKIYLDKFKNHMDRHTGPGSTSHSKIGTIGMSSADDIMRARTAAAEAVNRVDNIGNLTAPSDVFPDDASNSKRLRIYSFAYSVVIDMEDLLTDLLLEHDGFEDYLLEGFRIGIAATTIKLVQAIINASKRTQSYQWEGRNPGSMTINFLMQQAYYDEEGEQKTFSQMFRTYFNDMLATDVGALVRWGIHDGMFSDSEPVLSDEDPPNLTGPTGTAGLPGFTNLGPQRDFSAGGDSSVGAAVTGGERGGERGGDDFDI